MKSNLSYQPINKEEYKTTLVFVESTSKIYKLFIFSVLDYCSVVFHSSLTEQQTNFIERVQKICLKLILSEEYDSYSSALASCDLSPLVVRKEKRVLAFSKKALDPPKHKTSFPFSKNFLSNPHNLRYVEKFQVNFLRNSVELGPQK